MKTVYRRLYLGFLLLTAATAEGAVLKGIVIENELGGPPLENVEISAASGGNPTVSHSNGAFALEFPSFHPGDRVRVVVKKSGHVVVNDVQLEQALPANPDATPLTILLCKEGVREEMASRFYRLKSLEAIRQRYEEELAKLQEQQHENVEALSRLAQERHRAIAAAQTTAEQLAKVNPEESSQLYREAMRLFLEGKIDRALNVLDEEKLRRATTAVAKKREEADKQLAELVQAWLLKAQLLTTQFRFKEAEDTHASALSAAPESFEANFAFALFNHELNRFDKANEAYARALGIAQRQETVSKVAMTLNNLGVLHRAQNRMEEARKAHEESLKIRRALAEKNPDTYLPDVAKTLNNLGVLHREQNRMEEARKAYEESLKIRRALAEKNPDTYLPYVANTLNNLGVLHRAQNRMEEARKAYEEALKSYRALAEKNPDTYLPDVAMTLNNLGNLRRDQNRKEEARKAFIEALDIYTRFAKRDPDQYSSRAALVKNNLEALGH